MAKCEVLQILMSDFANITMLDIERTKDGYDSFLSGR